MKTVTIKRGADGFGSQVLSIISGIAYAKKHGMKYIHTPINSIKLVNMSEHKNDELIRANDMLNNIMIDMGFEVGSNADIIEPFFHKDILNNGVSFYYTDLLMEELQKAYFKNTEKPKYYCDEMNIAIHIRTGFDLVPSDVNRIIPMSVYNKIIVKIKEKYPKAKLHVFSWYDIKLDNQEIIYHISNDGGFFLDDFNGLVYSDLLVIGSSSFSMSAGLFNKGIVICNEELFKCTDPIPTQWIDNYNKILK